MQFEFEDSGCGKDVEYLWSLVAVRNRATIGIQFKRAHELDAVPDGLGPQLDTRGPLHLHSIMASQWESVMLNDIVWFSAFVRVSPAGEWGCGGPQ